MTSKIGYLLMIAGLAIALIGGAAILTTDNTRFHNDFVRKLHPQAVEFYGAYEFERSVSIAGIAQKAIFLQSGDKLISMSLDMSHIDTTGLENPMRYEITVDGPNCFLQGGDNGMFQSGNSTTWDIDTTVSGLPGFTAFQPISKNTAILRKIDLNRRKNLFTLSNNLAVEKDILETQVDGILCTDGFLEYSKTEHQAVYLYRYRNQFFCLDTALNIHLFGKTIDTTSRARISVAETDGKLTMSQPPFTVNKAISVDGRYMFVNSNLVAKNEKPTSHDDRSVVDVYDIIDGSYLYSFYIDDHAGTKMRTFKVRGSILIAAFPRHVVRYDLHLPNLNN